MTFPSQVCVVENQCDLAVLRLGSMVGDRPPLDPSLAVPHEFWISLEV